MPRIYETNFRDNTDIFPECLIRGEIAKEIWFFPDTSVLVLLAKIFVDRNFKEDNYDITVYQFIKELSTKNLNVMPMAIVEASVLDKTQSSLKIDKPLMQKLFMGLLTSQCLDINSINKLGINSWKLDNKRTEFILGTFKEFKNFSSLKDLAESMTEAFSSEHSTLYLKQAKELEREVVRPMLELARFSYIHGGNSLGKIKTFKKGVEDFNIYSPKIIDFCLQSILFTEKQDSLTQGAIKKFKEEIDHCAIDIALSELAYLSNVWRFFEDISTINLFFTCDRQQCFFSRLGNQLELVHQENVSNRVYHPNFSVYEVLGKKCLNEIISIFKLNSPVFLKQQIAEMYGVKHYENLIMEDFKIFKEYSKYEISYSN